MHHMQSETTTTTTAKMSNAHEQRTLNVFKTVLFYGW